MVFKDFGTAFPFPLAGGTAFAKGSGLAPNPVRLSQAFDSSAVAAVGLPG
jgi:hypothetical protein